MFLEFPLVSNSGVLTGAVAFVKLKNIVSVENMTKYVDRDNGVALVDGCVTICMGTYQHDVKIDFNELVKLLKDYDELGGL